ncbi:MAG TPA: phospholipid carrier-dependent glycosyltransferase, partial [Propionibacteriaceae bacterium]|nr:phospholipid carrier-dependent glycosyltransferase [Propionibacteriaceae bacterium]
MTDGLLSWVITLAIAALAFFLRFVNLARPKNLVFDETYYPKEAWSMLAFGYERDFIDKANDLIAEGKIDASLFKDSAAYVVHPPLGKWLIAGGEWMFGMNSFGWRFASLIFGTLLVVATIRLARRLARSTLIGAVAGILLTFDGLAFVMSRTGLLDIFQATFIVAAVACVVADRDWFRHRLADHIRSTGLMDLGGAYGPALWFRPWRLVAGMMFGCAIAVKWNALFVLAAFGVLSVIWDVTARRVAGARGRVPLSIIGDGVPAFLSLVPVAAAVYVSTWAPWLVTYRRQPRGWGLTADPTLTRIVGEPLAALLDYHRQMYDFHTGTYMKEATHVYEANPAGWLILKRPIGIDAVNDIKTGVDGCTAVNDTCLRVISGMGTPILWWLALAALVAGIVWWIADADWRFSVPIIAAMSTYLPWFRYADRPLFYFYAITIIPFTVTILAMALGRLMGPDRHGRRRVWGSVMMGGVVLAVVVNFAFIYPVLTDELLTRKQWLLRM